jgi:hypothetical protein
MSNVPWNPQQPAGGMGLPPALYSNAVQVTFSPYDLALNFFHLSVVPTLGEASGGDAPAQPQVVAQSNQRVVMSPQHAKAFVRVLRENLEKYEAQFGALPDIDLQQTPQ